MVGFRADALLLQPFSILPARALLTLANGTPVIATASGDTMRVQNASRTS
jgi:hypothetical protein